MARDESSASLGRFSEPPNTKENTLDRSKHSFKGKHNHENRLFKKKNYTEQGSPPSHLWMGTDTQRMDPGTPRTVFDLK